MSVDKRVVVTGGAGFIGSHVVDFLIEKGYEVIVFDDLSSGNRDFINKKARFEKIDVTNFKKVLERVSRIKPGCIFHLAAWPRIMRSVSDPIGTNKVNVDGTLSVLEAARAAGVKKFIYSSSSSIYGDQKEFKMKESFIPNPKSLYAMQKLIGERYCDFYAKEFGMEIVSLRYFNVYGPRQPENGIYSLVIGKFLNMMKNKKKLTIFGDGKQTRDYTFVSDVARANYLAMKVKSRKNLIINIGTGKEISVNEVAKLIGGQVTHIIPNPRGKYEERRKCADITMAGKILGWTPKTSLEEGINSLK